MGTIGGIVGIIVAAIVLAIVEAVAEGIADGLISDGVSGALGGFAAIPLGPIGGGLTLTSIVLDDLQLHSTIVRSVSVPVKTQVSHSSFGGFSLDLDSGVISADTRAGTDLIWDQAFEKLGPRIPKIGCSQINAVLCLKAWNFG